MVRPAGFDEVHAAQCALMVVRRQRLERWHGHDTDLPREYHPPSAESVAVRSALARLRPRYRTAVFLRYYLDLPESAIADGLCLPMAQLHRRSAQHERAGGTCDGSYRSWPRPPWSSWRQR